MILVNIYGLPDPDDTSEPDYHGRTNEDEKMEGITKKLRKNVAKTLRRKPGDVIVNFIESKNYDCDTLKISAEIKRFRMTNDQGIETLWDKRLAQDVSKVIGEYYPKAKPIQCFVYTTPTYWASFISCPE